MSKGKKRCGLAATVGGLRRIEEPFRVSINAKGEYFWHVYRKSVLAIDGKKNIETKHCVRICCKECTNPQFGELSK
jgi:hypothetical protein